MTSTPNQPHPDTTPEVDPSPETEPGDVPQGPQETNPDADDVPADTERGAPSRPHGDPLTDDAEPGQMPDHNTEVGA